MFLCLISFPQPNIKQEGSWPEGRFRAYIKVKPVENSSHCSDLSLCHLVSFPLLLLFCWNAFCILSHAAEHTFLFTLLPSDHLKLAWLGSATSFISFSNSWGKQFLIDTLPKFYFSHILECVVSLSLFLVQTTPRVTHQRVGSVGSDLPPSVYDW